MYANHLHRICKNPDTQIKSIIKSRYPVENANALSLKNKRFTWYQGGQKNELTTKTSLDNCRRKQIFFQQCFGVNVSNGWIHASSSPEANPTFSSVLGCWIRSAPVFQKLTSLNTFRKVEWRDRLLLNPTVQRENFGFASSGWLTCSSASLQKFKVASGRFQVAGSEI